MRYSPQNPICEVCMGWYLEVEINGIKWLKCASCSHMKLVSKRDVTPIADKLKKE